MLCHCLKAFNLPVGPCMSIVVGKLSYAMCHCDDKSKQFFMVKIGHGHTNMVCEPLDHFVGSTIFVAEVLS